METPKPGFLSPALMTSAGQAIPHLVWDGLVVLCTKGNLSSISDFYLIDASNCQTPPTHTLKHVPRHCQMPSPGGWGESWFENHLLSKLSYSLRHLCGWLALVFVSWICCLPAPALASRPALWQPYALRGLFCLTNGALVYFAGLM